MVGWGDTLTFMEFSIGDRVRITDQNHWAKGALGTVTDPPELARCVGPGWNEHTRTMVEDGAELTMYWVQFDSPQHDPEGDGPYDGSEVDSRFLEKA